MVRDTKIALTIPTGRPRVKHVVRSFIENAESQGYNPREFSVYLSIDPAYQRTQTRDFYLAKSVEEKLGSVTYISPTMRRDISSEIITETGADPVIINDLFNGRGYSRQRNSALLMALRDGNDIAVCIDDDEAPYIPVENADHTITWRNLDFFTPHISELSTNAEITRGPYIGYLSPIPSDFERNLPARLRKKLGEALEPGNEVVNKDTFFDLMNKIKYLPEEELTHPTRPFRAEETFFGKQILSGNMGINLDSVRKGKIPIFYTPPEARGEDAIFASQLSDVNVSEVPSYIFHDPFNKYPDVLNEVFPRKLGRIEVDEKTKERFAGALIGWLKYAPMLIYLSTSDTHERESRINEMLDKIEEPTQQLADILECPLFSTCKTLLEDYVTQVPFHYDILHRSQQVWRKDILPWVNGPTLAGSGRFLQQR